MTFVPSVHARSWRLLVLRGVCALAFGVVAIAWPDITIGALVIVFAAFVLADGIFALLTAAFSGGEDRGWTTLGGLAGVAAGIVTFVWPGLTTVALLWIIAAWAIVTGMAAIVGGLLLRRYLVGEWLLIAAGALSVALGVLLVVDPSRGALAMIYIVGGYAIAAGVVLVWLGIRLRDRVLT
jgi:uncharacterized membrane protein HdeD (DUF308 family)